MSVILYFLNKLICHCFLNSQYPFVSYLFNEIGVKQTLINIFRRLCLLKENHLDKNLALMQVKFRAFDSLDELKTTFWQHFGIMSH